MSPRPGLSAPFARGRAGAFAATVLLLGVGLTIFANRAIPPTGAVNYGDRDAPGPAHWELMVETPGTLPTGAVVVEGTWLVQAESDAPGARLPVCQVAGGLTGIMPVDFVLMDKRFPLLALDAPTGADLGVEARFKLLGGNVDRAAGIAFRIRDQDNYYVVRANGLESNANLYRFVDGRRSIIREARAEIASGVWHTLRVEARGTSIRWSLNGSPLGEVEDSTYRSGGIGLWTKADSVSCFAGLQVRAL